MMISLPFQFDGSGRVRSTDDPREQAVLRLASLIDTSPGERLMRPMYGTSARQMVFENDPEAPHVALTSSISGAVKEHEPDIRVVDVTATSSTLGHMDVEVVYSIEETLGVRLVQTAVISVGGDVDEMEEPR